MCPRGLKGGNFKLHFDAGQGRRQHQGVLRALEPSLHSEARVFERVLLSGATRAARRLARILCFTVIVSLVELPRDLIGFPPECYTNRM